MENTEVFHQNFNPASLGCKFSAAPLPTQQLTQASNCYPHSNLKTTILLLEGIREQPFFFFFNTETMSIIQTIHYHLMKNPDQSEAYLLPFMYSCKYLSWLL